MFNNVGNKNILLNNLRYETPRTHQKQHNQNTPKRNVFQKPAFGENNNQAELG